MVAWERLLPAPPPFYTTFHFGNVMSSSLGAVARQDLNVARPFEISTHSGMRNVHERVCVWGHIF